MDENAFWQLIDHVRGEYPDELEDQCTYLGEVLRRLPPEECRSAGLWFDAALQRAFHWPLWGAAFLIGEGCSDDSFVDFRAALVMRGWKAFHSALHDPDSLAQITMPYEAWFFEGFQYVVHEAMDEAADEAGGEEIPPPPDEPTGTEWREDELPTLLPRLYAKHIS